MTKPNWLFWLIAVLFLLWNLAGCGAYLSEVTMDDAAYALRYGEGVAALRDAVPTWSVAGFAIAVWGGLLGSILFLLRRGLATPVFVVSLIAAVIGFLPLFTVEGMWETMGMADKVMPLFVLIAGALEIWASRRYRAKGVLR